MTGSTSWAFVFRTNDLDRWGTGKNAPLVAVEFDRNNYDLLHRVQWLEDNSAAAPKIVSFEVIGTTFVVHMSDGSTLGPYDFPTMAWNFVGIWQPAHAYYLNDVLTYNGVTYQVLFNHTSAATFDPGANDGLGHSYYGLLLESAAGIPVGGETGMVLSKTSDSDYDAHWQLLSELGGLPPGGTASQVLIKNTTTNYDARWDDPPSSVPGGGTVGQVLTRITGTPDYDWRAVQALPAGGTTGQALIKATSSDFDVGWANMTTRLDALGDCSIASPANGDILVYSPSGSAWYNRPSPDKVQTIVPASNQIDILYTDGRIGKVTLTSNITGFFISQWPDDGFEAIFTLYVTNNASWNITAWPSGTKWPGGTAPTITTGAGKVDIIELRRILHSGDIYGRVVGQNY